MIDGLTLFFTHRIKSIASDTTSRKDLPHRCTIMHAQPEKAPNLWNSIKLPYPSTLKCVLHNKISQNTLINRISRKIPILCKFPHQSILTTSKLLNWDCSNFLFNARRQDKGQTLPLPLKITPKINYGELHILPS